jgi:AraC family transcriptional regulator
MGDRLEPWTNDMRLDHTATLRTHCYADRFSVVRVATTGRLPDAIRKSSSVPALLVSMSLEPIAARDYRLWVEGKSISTGMIPAFRANVIDLAAEPTSWADRGFHVAHFHVRRAAIDEVATDLGYERVGEFRTAVAEDDAVLAQITRNVLPSLGRSKPGILALDHVELIIAAHVMQRYGAPRKRRGKSAGGLATWQQQRVTELLRERLDGGVRLAELAELCDLSVSRFAHSFKASFGVSAHRWLLERRVERAQELLAHSRTSLVDIASQCGFADQAAFSRTFQRIVGISPGRWRRGHAVRPVR